MIIPQEIIRKKRNNETLTKYEIDNFIKEVTSNKVTDAQIAAFTMSVFFNGLQKDELVNLTLAMRDSGEVMNWEGVVDGPVVDKHSTGGVGDLVSLILAPVVAACGGFIPMITGRGLGHTGGTTDKLEAIPNYQTQINGETFKKVVKEVGVAVIGQSSDIAPADKRIYGVRDTTATTESIELITASILSKKLASGLQSMVMDVKTGNGAFMEKMEESEILAKFIVDISNKAGCKTSALITDMSQPLAKTLGNALEIQNTVEYLKGDHSNHRLHEINVALGVEMLLQSGICKDKNEAKEKFLGALNSGKAAEVFSKMVTSLGGPSDFLENSGKYLQKAPYIKDVYLDKEGYISQFDTKKIGMAIVALGGGRTNPKDSIDHSVGITNIVELGDKIDPKIPLATIHAKSENDYLIAKQILEENISIEGDKNKLKIPSLIYKHIS